MAENDLIEAPPDQATDQQGDGPGPSLSADNTKRLAQALIKMKQAGESDDRIKLFVGAYHKKYDQTPQQPIGLTPVPAPHAASENTMNPVQRIKMQTGEDVANNPELQANRKRYNDLRTKAITDIEGDEWRDKIFQGQKPALTDKDLPLSSYQHPDPDQIEKYLDTQGLDNKDRYWMRNQLLNYGKQRQMQGAVNERLERNIDDLPQVQQAKAKANEQVAHGLITQDQYDQAWKQELAGHKELIPQLEQAYVKAQKDEELHRQQATANRLNNIGLDDKPLANNAPFHDQITGVNKALMGVLNYPADIGGQISSLLELGGVPGLSDLGYKLKVNADQMKEHYALPQNGELGSTLAGLVPQALDMAALSRLSGAVSKPLYQSLGKARAAGKLGQFAEGAIGGLAVSPANAYVMAHQYYNDLIKQGMTPDEAGHKSDQLLLKNLMTDMVALPLQMGLLKLNSGPWMQRALGKVGEATVSGLHFAAQDFNMKSVDNPALSILNYVQNDPGAKESFLTGAALGFVQKAAVDAMHNWDVKKETSRLFDYGRQYGGDTNKSLPSNKTIANTILSGIEMKDTPERTSQMRSLVDAMKENGQYTPEEADRINKVIDDVDAVRGKVPKYGTPFQRIAVFNELLNQRSAERYVEQSGNKGAAKGPEEAIKESAERIGRIMDGSEPLYFVNGNETTKEQLRKAIDEDPDLINRPGARIDIRNDSDFANEIKTKKDAIQEQKSDANAVRHPPADGQTVGGRDEGQGAVNEKTPGKEGEGVTEARHSINTEDEEGRSSGQMGTGLSDDGVVMAHELRDDVYANYPNINKIVGSDSPRSKETADIVSRGEIPVETDARNRSWNLNDFNDTPDADFDQIKKWFAENPNDTKYGGPLEKYKDKELGESLNAYAKRTIDFRNEINKEGPDTLLINHSENISIYDAYKANGNKWDEEAIRDYVERPSPEPATVHDQPAEDKTATKLNDNIESGEVTGEQLANTARLFIQDGADEKGESIPAIQSADTTEAGSSEADTAPRQFAKGTRGPQNVPTPSQGQTPPGQNQGGQPVSGGPSAPDPARLTKDAKRLLLSDRTDDQVLSYLKRKGLSDPEALAALGEAKANPIDEVTKAASIKDAVKREVGKENDLLGAKELAKVNSQVQTRQYQKDIQKSVKADPGQKKVRWRDVDKAIHIYLDTQANPTHIGLYYDKLLPEQQKIVDLSQTLNPAQLKIADAIKKEYEALGTLAKDAGVIKDTIENYVARAWERNGKAASEESFKFNTSTRHSLQRTLETILQGYAEGMKLKIEGASNNLHVLKQEINNVIENKKLLDYGLSLKYDSGETDANGKPIKKSLFSENKEDGYAAVNSPAFKKWSRAGKLEEYSAEEQQLLGRRRDVIVTENGMVLKKEPVYAPEEVAKSLNNIMKSKASSSDVVNDLLKTNALIKQTILSYSGFHFLAFTKAHILSGKFNLPMKGVNPISAYRTGLRMLTEQHPIGQELIKRGMTINRAQDWNEAFGHEQSRFGKLLDKNGITKAVKDKLVNLNEQMHKMLFNSYGAGLKMFDGINLAKNELRKNPNASPEEVTATYERVAKLMNDTYGGINWDRMRGTRMQNPTNRSIASLMFLAPDWTASNLRMAKKAIAFGDDAKLYRKAWGRVILRGVMLTAAANAIMAVWDDKDDDGNELSWPDAMARRASKAWDIGRLRSTMVDITPLYHAIGGASDKRAYFSIFGAYADPIKMVTNTGDFLESKGSYVSKVALEALTSQNWQHQEFTTLDELLGMDDKGEYTKTVEEHQAGDINPNTGEPYKRDQKGHDEGDQKGGQLKAHLTKSPRGGAHPITKEQLPSFILNEVRGMMPTAVQNFLQIINGENDATTGILNAAGTGILVSKEPKKKDDE